MIAASEITRDAILYDKIPRIEEVAKECEAVGYTQLAKYMLAHVPKLKEAIQIGEIKSENFVENHPYWEALLTFANLAISNGEGRLARKAGDIKLFMEI